MEHDSDSSSEPLSPAAKTSKCDVKSTQSEAPNYSFPRPAIQRMNSLPTPVSPDFAPRAEYVKLIFTENPGVNVKLRWPSEVVKMFNLDRELAEV